MRTWAVALLLVVVCMGVYWPHRNAQFVLDDYYTVVGNPLIKNPSLYPRIWTSRLFDANASSGYIKFGYYRPLLESSWILDYRMFGLKARGYQYINLFIHVLNCILIYILFLLIFNQPLLGLKAALLFSVLPTQEWVVRYVTGRGDELSALFGLLGLIFLTRAFKAGFKQGCLLVFISLGLAALAREVALSYILYALLIYYHHQGRAGGINRFCAWWVLIGILPLAVIWSIVAKQGNILIWHILYFASAGICLWMAQGSWRRTVLLFVLFAAVSFYQGRFWSTEEGLLAHTRSLEWWPRTVVDQQLLMKYEDDAAAVKDMADRTRNPLIKAMWLRRLGIIYFQHGDLSAAGRYFAGALAVNPSDVDSLDALAVVAHIQGHEQQSLDFLTRALNINPAYPDTLRTLGIRYYIYKDFSRARFFLSRCLFFDPDNAQARSLLGTLPTL